MRKRDFGEGAFAEALIEACESAGVDWIVLAGYMVILPAAFLRRFAGKIVNIHPSLLPLFPGLHPHQQALDAGSAESGCTVHLVEPGEVDGGRVLAQVRVPVAADDDADSLASRVLGEEHRLYPETLVRLFSGQL
jgi:phosphoribosylglycinamide formyltransferase-1